MRLIVVLLIGLVLLGLIAYTVMDNAQQMRHAFRRNVSFAKLLLRLFSLWRDKEFVDGVQPETNIDPKEIERLVEADKERDDRRLSAPSKDVPLRDCLGETASGKDDDAYYRDRWAHCISTRTRSMAD